jgi:histidinol phosphatase-like enzyme (inositol monophosphatase family)
MESEPMMAGDGVPRELLELGLSLVEASGAVLRRHFRAGLRGDIKGDGSPVTVADRETERAIRAILERRRPQDGIIGEEEGVTNRDAEFVWVIDPIDGTKPFMIGRPTFVTLVALLRGGRPILGIIDQPIIGERWIGIAGERPAFNGRPVSTRPCADLKSAVLYSGSVEFGEAGRNRFFKLAARASVTTLGGDAFAYGLLAAGFVDICVDWQMQLYDVMALVPIVEGAGGAITMWNGKPIGFDLDGTVIAAGDRRAHAQAVAVLAG